MQKNMFHVTPLRPDWKWRPTSRGFALIGAVLAPSNDSGSELLKFGHVRAYRPGLEVAWENYKAMLDGSVRYALDYETGEFRHESGPFVVAHQFMTKMDKKDGLWSMQQSRCQLICACGWRGKVRSINAARHMVADQAKHRCRENFQ